MIKFFNHNPEIPLGSSLFKQKVEKSGLEFVDNVNVTTTVDIYPNYIATFTDNLTTKDEFKIEFTNEKTITFSHDVNTSSEFECIFNPQKYEVIFQDNASVIDDFGLETSIDINFEDNFTLSESLDLIYNKVDFSIKFEDNITMEETTDYISTSRLTGDVLIDNSIRNKYVEETFVDTLVDPNKTYIYRFRAVNDIGKYTDVEREITVSPKEVINTVNNAIITLTNTENKVKIKIDDPNDTNWVKTEIYRSLNPINNINPGELILTNTIKDKYLNNPYSDTVEYGKTYYYKAFTYSNNYVNKTGENKSITIKIPSESIPPSPIQDLSLTPYNNVSCYLNWSDPSDINWIKTVIVRKENEPPLNPDDGTVMFINTERDRYKVRYSLEVETPLEDTKYYFKAFPYNDYTYNHLGNYIEVQTLDITPPNKLSSEKIAYNDYKVNISFNVLDKTTKGVRIIRNTDRNEIFYNRGEEIVDLITSKVGAYSYEDLTTKANTQYYYRCQAYDEAGNINKYGDILECYTLDTRIPNITDLRVELNGEDLIFTWTNPNSEYFLNTEIYYSTNLISDLYPGVLIGSNDTPNFTKLVKSIHSLSNHGTLYFLAVPIDYRGNKFRVIDNNVSLLVKDTIPPNPIEDLNIVQDEMNLKITWSSPDNIDWASETLVMKEGSEPSTISDGKILTTTTYKNNYKTYPFNYKISKGNYFFKVFPKDKNDNVNNIGTPAMVSYNNLEFNEGVSDVSLELDKNNVIIKWRDPNSILWGATKVIRNNYYIPTDHTDGEIVVINNERNQYAIDGYVDRNLEVNNRYYYALFTRDKDGNYTNIIAKESILIRDMVPPKEVQNLSIEKLDNGIGLTWKDTDDYDWGGVKLVKSTRIPTNTLDGQLLIDNTIKDRFEVIPFVDNDLQLGVTYYYRLFTYDIYGNTTGSNYVTYVLEDTTPPGIVTDFNVQQTASITTTNLLLRWTDPNDLDWNYTKICYSSSSEVLPGDTEIARGNERNQYSIDGCNVSLNLAANTTYYFKAFTYDFNGNVNTSCQTLSLYVLPNIQIGNSKVTAKYEDYSIKINIDDDEIRDFDGCVLVKSTSSISNINNGKVLLEYYTPDEYKTKTIIDKDIKEYTTHYYKAFPYKMFDSTRVYNNDSEQIKIYINKTTAPPILPIGVGQINDYILISWDDTFVGNTYYLVKNTNRMPIDENDGEVIATNLERITWYKDYDITPGTTYYYRTFTVDNYGNWNRTYEGVSFRTEDYFEMGEITSLKAFKWLNKDEFGYFNGIGDIAITWDDPNSESWVQTEVLFKSNTIPTLTNASRSIIVNTFADRYKDHYFKLREDYKYSIPYIPDGLNSAILYFKAFPKDNYQKVLTDGNVASIKITSNDLYASRYEDKYSAHIGIDKGIGCTTAGDITYGYDYNHTVKLPYYNKYGDDSLFLSVIKKAKFTLYYKEFSIVEFYNSRKQGKKIMASTSDKVLYSCNPLEFNPDLQKKIDNTLILDDYISKIKGKFLSIVPCLEFDVTGENYEYDKLSFIMNQYEKRYNTIYMEKMEAQLYYEFDEENLYLLFLDSTYNNSRSLRGSLYYQTDNTSTSTRNYLIKQGSSDSPYLQNIDFNMDVLPNFYLKLFKIPLSNMPDKMYFKSFYNKDNFMGEEVEYSQCNITITKPSK